MFCRPPLLPNPSDQDDSEISRPNPLGVPIADQESHDCNIQGELGYIGSTEYESG